MPTPYSHGEDRLLPYDSEASLVQRCLWAPVTAAQDEPSLAPWPGPAKQHTYGLMPAAAADKVFQHLHAAHDALACVAGGHSRPWRGQTRWEGNPPKAGSGSRRRFSGTMPWQRAHQRRTMRTQPRMASTPKWRSG